MCARRIERAARRDGCRPERRGCRVDELDVERVVVVLAADVAAADVDSGPALRYSSVPLSLRRRREKKLCFGESSMTGCIRSSGVTVTRSRLPGGAKISK